MVSFLMFQAADMEAVTGFEGVCVATWRDKTPLPRNESALQGFTVVFTPF